MKYELLKLKGERVWRTYREVSILTAFRKKKLLQILISPKNGCFL